MRSDIMKSSFIILKDNNLIIEAIIGIVNIEDLRTHRDILYSDKNYNTYYDVLMDIRDAKMEINIEELTSYLNYLSSINVCAVRKTAILTRQKNQAEYAKAFSSLNDKYSLKFGVFSNVNDCVCFLDKKDISKDEIRAHIRKLKNDPHYQWFKGPNAITGF